MNRQHQEEQERLAYEKALDFAFVRSSWDLALRCYGNTKNLHPLLKNTVDAFENGGVYALHKVSPAFEIVKPQLNAVNSIALQQLARLEQYETMKKPIDQVYADTVKLATDEYLARKQAVADRVAMRTKLVKQYGADAVNAAYSRADGVMKSAEYWADYYMPASTAEDGEKRDMSKDDIEEQRESGIAGRSYHLTKMVSERLVNRAGITVKSVQEKSMRSVHDLAVSLNMMQSAREGIEVGRERLVGFSKDMTEKWNAMQKDDTPVNQRLWALSVSVADALRTNLNSISASTYAALPAATQDQLKNAVEYSSQLYENLYKAGEDKWKTVGFLENSREKLTMVNDRLNALAEQVTGVIGLDLSTMTFSFPFSPRLSVASSIESVDKASIEPDNKSDVSSEEDPTEQTPTQDEQKHESVGDETIPADDSFADRPEDVSHFDESSDFDDSHV